jgi:hypothetical protein
MPNRAKALLDEIGMFFPDKVLNRIVNVSQSGATQVPGKFPTITPHGSYWVGKEMRWSEGIECLSAQGLWHGEIMRGRTVGL